MEGRVERRLSYVGRAQLFLGRRSMRSLVTADCGLIGWSLIEVPTAAGHRRALLDDLSPGGSESPGPEIAPGHGGVGDLATVPASSAARRSPRRPARTKRGSPPGGSIRAACLPASPRARRNRLRLVYAFSAAVYRAETYLPFAESAPTRSMTAYGTDKLGRRLDDQPADLVQGVPSAVLRFFSVFVPRRLSSSPCRVAIAIVADRVRRGLPRDLRGGGKPARNLVCNPSAARRAGSGTGQSIFGRSLARQSLHHRSDLDRRAPDGGGREVAVGQPNSGRGEPHFGLGRRICAGVRAPGFHRKEALGPRS